MNNLIKIGRELYYRSTEYYRIKLTSILFTVSQIYKYLKRQFIKSENMKLTKSTVNCLEKVFHGRPVDFKCVELDHPFIV